MLYRELYTASVLADTFRRLVSSLVSPFISQAWPLPIVPWPPSLISTPETVIYLKGGSDLLQRLKRLNESTQDDCVLLEDRVSPGVLFRER
ncbi:MAG TPA: hypothetical protein VFM05_06405, partial [Candidatus Saccharimonadales bacterium]|nr:hypothetical protein [Candidatus Saccharimonadales bacterium]